MAVDQAGEERLAAAVVDLGARIRLRRSSVGPMAAIVSPSTASATSSLNGVDGDDGGVGEDDGRAGCGSAPGCCAASSSSAAAPAPAPASSSRRLRVSRCADDEPDGERSRGAAGMAQRSVTAGASRDGRIISVRPQQLATKRQASETQRLRGRAGRHNEPRPHEGTKARKPSGKIVLGDSQARRDNTTSHAGCL